VAIFPYFDGAKFVFGGDDGFRILSNEVVVVTDRNIGGFPNVGTTTAHEVGHILGFGEEYCLPESEPFPCSPTIFQVNFPPQSMEVGDRNGNYLLPFMGGFDVSEFVPGRTAVFAPQTGDPVYGFMGGGLTAPRQIWVTQAEYEHLFDELTTPANVSAPLETVRLGSNRPMSVAALEGIDREVMLVSGLIGKDGLIELEPFQVATTDTILSTPQGSQYTVELLDDAGAVLNTASFDLAFKLERLGVADEDPVVDIDVSPFNVTVELPELTHTVRVLEGQIPLAEVSRSPNRPSVVITDMDISLDGKITVDWEGSDADGDPLNYTVFYAPDGASETVVDSVLSNTSVTFSPTDISTTIPSLAAIVRIRANDGFNVDDTRASLSFGGNADPIFLKQYRTHGPGLPGMCSKKGCAAHKRHTLVAKNVLSDSNVRADFTLVVDAVPQQGCTVNGEGIGGVISVAEAITIPPGRQIRQDTELRFVCTDGSGSLIGQDFLLRARVTTTNGFDLTPANNELTKSQTIR
jgi:hypothetical protein